MIIIGLDCFDDEKSQHDVTHRDSGDATHRDSGTCIYVNTLPKYI